jgi:hypothetical protein
MANVDAFCALLKDLNARPIVTEPRAFAIAMVRAGILCGAIGAVMACLDPADRRGNRASIGQILETLKDTTLAHFFATAGRGSTMALHQARKSYDDLRESGSYKRVKRLRDKAVAHTLNTLPPEAGYEDVYKLAEIAEKIVIQLFAACGRGPPEFLGSRLRTAEHAKIFWDTYFWGMSKSRADKAP